MKKVKITHCVSRREFVPERPLLVLCMSCASELDIHQPDLKRPGRLLGTCEECGSWHLLTCRTERLDMVVAQLPGGEAIELAAGALSIDQVDTVVTGLTPDPDRGP